MKYGGLGVLALLLIIAIALGIAREYAPISKVCNVTYNDNTVATYECRYVDVQKNRIVAFSRGYKKPTMFFHACTFQTSDTVPSWRKSHPEWGEPETPHYIIGLGERVELVD